MLHSGSGGGASAVAGTPPLPLGAATSANQTSEISLLTTINASLNAIVAINPFVSGSFASPNIINVGGFAIGDYWNELQYVKSNGGAVTITADPQIAPSSKDGAQLRLYGTSNTDSLTLNDGAGLLLNGPIILSQHSVITLIWNGTLWVEVSRNGI